ncbi:hypothetical protein BKA64DRAFT_717060 [Cadophora sp. MPI-SDFR-AT-0126]|nr:hypothetical protein BKA64DRAFT_717060 [Leotiomycetes sp. MPI-SDFR-AT-0126]
MRSPSKVALITGAGSGIGLYMARKLRKDGWEISLAELVEETGRAAAQEVEGLFTKVDVTNYESQARAFEATWGKYGLFANAGILDVADFYAHSETLPPPEPSLMTSRVSYDGAVYSSYLAMHYFRQNPDKTGIVVMTSSASALYDYAILPIYCSSKYGVVGLARSLGVDLQKENIRVNAVLPGAVPSNIGLPVKLKNIVITATLPDDVITTSEHICDAVSELIDDPNAFGVIMEVSGERRYRRPKHDYSDNQMAFLMGEKESWAEK